MILYHGTTEEAAEDILLNGVNFEMSNIHTDFGRGFYLTSDLTAASRMAIRRSANRQWVRPAVLSFDYDLDEARMVCSFKDFDHANLEWARFVVNNRCGMKYVFRSEFKDNNIGPSYDIVHGEIADGNIVELTRRLRSDFREINEMDLQRILGTYRIGDQYSLHTKIALQYIKSVRHASLRNR